MSTNVQLTSQSPYLLRAYYEWLVDNKLTPHILVDTTVTDVHLPTEHAHEGKIILNISQEAVGNLDLGNHKIVFSTRFGGNLYTVSIPLVAVLAIYANENGVGTVFEHEVSQKGDTSFAKNRETIPTTDNSIGNKNPSFPHSKRPRLSIIK